MPHLSSCLGEKLLALPSGTATIVAGVSQPETPLPFETPDFIPPKWVSWLIALVPIFPPLYLAAFGSLKLLRALPLTARWMLFFFASTQLVAALFTPRPLLSLGLAAARILLILAMISAGVYLRDSQNLRPLLWGQLVIFATAWGYTLYTQGLGGVQTRLGHPYYYIVSLGLVAVIALWIIILWRGGSLLWRIPAGLFALATFLAAGSRGPLLALVSGIIFLPFQKRAKALLLLTSLLFILLTAHLGSTFSPVKRLLSDELNGRGQVWEEAVVGIKYSPLGGVGMYQGGLYLSSLLKDGCHLTPTIENAGLKCPLNLSKVSYIWLIAHNGVLNVLLEGGLFSLLGYVLVVSYMIYLMFLLKNETLIISILVGFGTMNLFDVVYVLPTQHFTELGWVFFGILITKSKEVV